MTPAETPVDRPGGVGPHEHHWVEVLHPGNRVWFYCTGCEEKRIVTEADAGYPKDQVILVQEDAHCPECGHRVRVIHRNSGAIYYRPIEDDQP